MLIALQSSEPSADDWGWLDRYREAAFDKLMPVATGPLVAYRSFQDLFQHVQERYFTIA